MTRIIFFLAILTISACSSNQDELEKLKAENQELRSKLQKIENEINDFEFSATVAEKNKNIKLGEEYISEIRILVYKKNSPIRIQLGKLVDNSFQLTSDTLFERLKRGGVYKYIPKEIGEYQYAGKVELDFFDTTIVRYFSTVYDVIEHN